MDSPGPLIDRVTAQLARELGELIEPLAVLAGPKAALEWPRQLARRARGIALTLCAGDDDDAAETCIDIMNALWPHGTPEHLGHADWWRTPLGQVCARSLGHRDSEAVTISVAAAMLGVTRGTVAQLLNRGKLDRHPDGGVLRASVLQRLAGR